jgi:cyclase
MSAWKFTKGLHDLGNGEFAYLQPSGTWGYSNAGILPSGRLAPGKTPAAWR